MFSLQMPCRLLRYLFQIICQAMPLECRVYSCSLGHLFKGPNEEGRLMHYSSRIMGSELQGSQKVQLVR